MSGSQRRHLDSAMAFVNKTAPPRNQINQLNRGLDKNSPKVPPVSSESKFLRPVDDDIQQANNKNNVSKMGGECNDAFVQYQQPNSYANTIGNKKTKPSNITVIKSKPQKKMGNQLTFKQIKASYQRAQFLLKKIEANKQAGRVDPRDKTDEEECKTAVEVYNQIIETRKSSPWGSFPQKFSQFTTKRNLDVKTGPETSIYAEESRAHILNFQRSDAKSQMNKELSITDARVLNQGDAPMYLESPEIKRLSRAINDTAFNLQVPRFANTKEHSNNTREYRDNNQWSETSTDLEYAVFRMSKKSPSRELTPPPPPIINWHGVINRVSTESFSERNEDRPVLNDNQQNRRDYKLENEVNTRMDGQNVNHNFIQSSLSSNNADNYNRNSRGGQPASVSKGYWKLESHESDYDNPKDRILPNKEDFWESEAAFQKNSQSIEQTKTNFDCNKIRFDHSMDEDCQDVRRFANPNKPEFRRMEGICSSESVNDNSRRNDNISRTKINLDCNKIRSGHSIDYDLPRIAGFANTNSPELRRIGPLESSNDNTRINDNICRTKNNFDGSQIRSDHSMDKDLRDIRVFADTNNNEFRRMLGLVSLGYVNDNPHRNDLSLDEDFGDINVFANTNNPEFSRKGLLCSLKSGNNNSRRNERDITKNNFDCNKMQSMDEDFPDIRVFANTNNPRAKPMDSLESVNVNTCRNDNMNDKDWTGDSFFVRSEPPHSFEAANDNTTKNYDDPDDICEVNNLDEERIEARVLIDGKVQCVSMNRKQHERYNKALKLGFPFADALDFSMKGLKKIGIIPRDLQENPFSLQEMQQIENVIINYATKWSFNTKLIGCYPQNGWLVILCNNEIADMITSHISVIRNICKLDINVVRDGERLFPPGHIIHGYFPHSINYKTNKVMELIQAQNDIPTTLWKSVHRKVEDGSVLNISFEVDDRSWCKLQELNGLIFYRFGQITLTLEENDTDVDRMSQFTTSTPYTSNSKEIAKRYVCDQPGVAQPQQYTQNVSLMKLDQLKKNIATNMKLMEQKRLLEENVTNDHMNRIYQSPVVMTNTSNPMEFPRPTAEYRQSAMTLGNSQNIQNAKISELKKNIANNMKLLAFRGAQYSNTTSVNHNNKMQPHNRS